jgi:hypothetical protein
MLALKQKCFLLSREMIPRIPFGFAIGQTEGKTTKQLMLNL